MEAERQAKWQAQKAQGWLEGYAILNAQIEEAKKQGAIEAQIAALKKMGGEQGFGAAIGSSATLIQGLADRNTQSIQTQNERTEREEAMLEEEMKSRSAKPQEWEAGYNAYMRVGAVN